MTPSAEALRQLVKSWREQAICYCSIHCDCNASGYAACVADLEALAAGLGDPHAPAEALRVAAQTVFDTFQRDEAAGYRSRDRQYALDILGRVLGVTRSPEEP